MHTDEGGTTSKVFCHTRLALAACLSCNLCHCLRLSACTSSVGSLVHSEMFCLSSQYVASKQRSEPVQRFHVSPCQSGKVIWGAAQPLPSFLTSH